MSRRYPKLYQLVAAYFHQDLDLTVESDEDVWRDYARTNWRKDGNRLVAEVDAFLRRYPTDTLAHFARELRPHLNLAESDEDIRRWLRGAAATIAASPAAEESDD